MSHGLSDAQQQKLAQILRVDHAGEFGAVRICKGQMAALPGDDSIQEIALQEQQHFDYFQKALIENGVSPTLFKPLWSALGYGLGYVGGKLNSKVAHACTIAIEEVIVEHYQKQLAELGTFPDTAEVVELRATIQQFLDEEAQHCHTAEEKGKGRQAKAFPVIERVVKGVSKIAIEISKRI